MNKQLIRYSHLGLSVIIGLMLSLIVFTTIHAQDQGDLDTTFNGTGIITTSIGIGGDWVHDVAIQPDGKIVVVGKSDYDNTYYKSNFAVVRYTNAGSLDTSFNYTGVVTTAIGDDARATSVAIQSDSKIVVAGINSVDSDHSDFVVARYTVNGALDTTFNGTGIVTTSIHNLDTAASVAIQLDGKIVVAGHSGNDDQNFAVARYLISGILDTTFNGTGIVTTSIDNATNNLGASVVLQPDGKIVVAGVSNFDSNNSKSDVAIVRYTINGVLDSSFNNTGVVTTSLDDSFDVVYDVALQPDGKIVAAGFSNYDFTLIRYTITGALDSTFRSTGIVTTPIDVAQEVTGVAVQPDGKIVAAGYSTDGTGFIYGAVARYQSNGLLDTTFHQTGIVTTPVGFSSGAEALALQPDGKIVMAGTTGVGEDSEFLVVRYFNKYPAPQKPGDLDITFNGTGVVTTPVGSNSDGYSVALQRDGKFVVVGDSWVENQDDDLALVRYTITGSLDSTFNGTGIVTASNGQDDDWGRAVAIQQTDGKIVSAGFTDHWNSSRKIMVTRHHENGDLDTDFGGTGIVTTSVSGRNTEAHAIAIQPNGKIVVAGRIGLDDDDFVVVRYSSDGSPDTDFGNAGVVTTPIGSGNDGAEGIAIQPDGKLLVAGTADNSFALVRYTITGTLDVMFNDTGVVTTPIGENSGAGAIAILPDGCIVIAGASGSGENVDFAVARYTTTGNLDTTWNGTGIVTTSIANGDYGNALVVQPNNKILVAGYSYNSPTVDDRFTLVRYNSDGSLDTTFNGTGVITTMINSRALGNGIALQPEGKIVVVGGSGSGGDFNFAVARYWGDRDTSYLPLILKN